MSNETVIDYFDETGGEDDLQAARRTLRIIFAIAYGLLFVAGTIGNGIVIAMICNVMTTMSRNARYRGRRRVSVSSTRHVFIYVLGLSIVDLLVILHLPFLIVDMLHGQWIFGTAMCKLYWFGECVNKLLSSFLMTVLSWDRYLAVCSPIKSFRVRSNSVAITVVLCCSLLAIILLFPVLQESTVVQVNKHNGLPLLDGTEERLLSDLHGTTISKCVFDAGSPLFMMYTFFAGYMIPALLITAFYLQVIIRLHKNARTVRRHGLQSKIQPTRRVQQVTKRIVAVILFYFFCWTPQWTLNILSQFSLITVSWSTLTLSSIFFAAHLLVCFNSAANPVLYALINRELRQQHVIAMLRRKQSISTATHAAIEFIEKHSHHSSPPASPGTQSDSSANEEDHKLKQPAPVKSESNSNCQDTFL